MVATRFWTSGLLGLALLASGSVACAQFEAPTNSLLLEDKGTFEAFEGGVLKYRDSKAELWIVTTNDQTEISVEGEAQIGCLRPGQNIRFTGELDKKGNLIEPIESVEIFVPQGKSWMGLFAADDAAESKALRNPGAGKYTIKGKLAGFRDGELTVMAGGNRKLTGETAEDLSVTLKLDDVSIAQSGDEVNLKAWYYDNTKPNAAQNRSGRALAESISIKLAKPLAAGGKKMRTSDKPARPTAKASRVSK